MLLHLTLISQVGTRAHWSLQINVFNCNGVSWQIRAKRWNDRKGRRRGRVRVSWKLGAQGACSNLKRPGRTWIKNYAKFRNTRRILPFFERGRVDTSLAGRPCSSEDILLTSLYGKMFCKSVLRYIIYRRCFVIFEFSCLLNHTHTSESNNPELVAPQRHDPLDVGDRVVSVEHGRIT